MIKKISSKRGFTLLEIIAVTVIIGVVFLIITPYILRLVEKSHYEATKASAIAYIEASEKAAMLYIIMNNRVQVSGKCDIEDAKLICENNTLSVDIQGNLPKEGTVTFKENGIVEEANNLVISHYVFNYKNGKWDIKDTK